MLSVSTNSIRNNYSQLKFKRNESDDDKRPAKSTAGNKIQKGTLITTAAFLAGFGTGKMLMPESTVYASPKEITAPMPKPADADNSNTITWEEATNSSAPAAPQSSNIPPSDKKRTWTKTTTFSANGEEHIAINKYTVMEVPFLVEQTVKNARTKQFEQKNTFADYQLIPTKVEMRGEGNKLLEKKVLNNMNIEYGVPESAKITTYNDDGSISYTDILYRMQMTFSDNKPKAKPQPKSEPKKESQSNKNTQDAFGTLMEDLFSN